MQYAKWRNSACIVIELIFNTTSLGAELWHEGGMLVENPWFKGN